MPAKHLEASVRLKPGGTVLDLRGEINGFAQEALNAAYTEANAKVPGAIILEAVREGSNTGESPQHQASHDRVDHGLATLAQPLVVPKLILLL
jgi:hypothetical protein